MRAPSSAPLALRLARRPLALAMLAAVASLAVHPAQAQIAPAQTLPQAGPSALGAASAGPAEGITLHSAGPSCDSCNRPLAQVAAPQTLPAAPQPGPSFRLNDLRLNGAQAIDAAALKALTAPYIGREVTLADLESLAQAITAHYRERGYFLAQALVPVQTVRDGVVEISIVEGRLGKVDVAVAPDAPIAAERVRGFVATLAPGEAVSAAAYERAMLLLSDQPGLKVSSALQEGAQPGTTDLSVEVQAAPRWRFTAEADNHGTKESGRYRLGGSVRYNSPFGIGDNLDARVLVSNGNALQHGRLSYEAPIGTGGLRIGGALSRVNYELGGEFEELGAQGHADVAELSLSYPLIRSRRQNLFLRVGVDDKSLTDEYTAAAYASKKQVRGLGLGWAWELRDDMLGGGYWASSGTLYRGSLDIRDAQTREFDQGLGGRDTQGGFTKLGFQVSRLQAVVQRHSLYLALGGQWASRNLDASEKLSLGGARAVRAYASSEALVDQGLIGTLEWRWSATEELTPFLFYDAARGRTNKNPGAFADSNHVSLRGGGLGLSWSRPGDFALNATLAWRAGTRPAQADGGGSNPRLYVQFLKAF